MTKLEALEAIQDLLRQADDLCDTRDDLPETIQYQIEEAMLHNYRALTAERASK